MSETIAVAAIGAVEQALAPEVEAALKDAHALVTAEADKLRQALPGLTEAAIGHVSSIAEQVLTGYHNVLAHLEAKLGIAVPAAAPVDPHAPQVPPALTVPTPVTPAPSEQGAPAPVAVDPTPAPSTTEAVSSAPSSETPAASSTIPSESPVVGQ